jgi:hypothetical protein
MKFTRRADLAPQTRIHIVMLAWLYQGVYGKMTEIANTYLISRTFLYPLLLAANLQLELLFSDEKRLFQKEYQYFEHLLLLSRLEGNFSLLSLSSILKALHYRPNSVGYLSQFFQNAGRALPSTLSMSSQQVVFYLSDEIFAIHAPILLTDDAQSTAILKIERASDRSAQTWRAHFEALENHDFVSLGLSLGSGPGPGSRLPGRLRHGLMGDGLFPRVSRPLLVVAPIGAQSLWRHGQRRRGGKDVCRG